MTFFEAEVCKKYIFDRVALTLIMPPAGSAGVGVADDPSRWDIGYVLISITLVQKTVGTVLHL